MSVGIVQDIGDEQLVAGPVWELPWVEFVGEAVEAERWRVVVAVASAVAVAVAAVAAVGQWLVVSEVVVEVGMTVVVFEGMCSVCGGLWREAVESWVLEGIARGLVVVLEGVVGVYSRLLGQVVVLVQVQESVSREERVKQREVWEVRR